MTRQSHKAGERPFVEWAVAFRWSSISSSASGAFDVAKGGAIFGSGSTTHADRETGKPPRTI